jgi:LDH2 family malate/lactate/ureidoglycolate dehydrogenase
MDPPLREGKSIPSGWAIDGEGSPTKDQERFLAYPDEGPFGGESFPPGRLDLKWRGWPTHGDDLNALTTF